ncbi:MAG: nitrilase-related carbon-nitrogen hydrolase [Bacteroides sp.]
MIIAIPQLNYKAGDIQEIAKKSFLRSKGSKSKTELILFPELAVSGALPDLLERGICKCLSYGRRKIAATCTQIAAIVGAPNLDSENGIMYNSAYFIQNGKW